MNRDTFEKMATQYGLDLNRNEHNYLNYITQMAWEFYDGKDGVCTWIQDIDNNYETACADDKNFNRIFSIIDGLPSENNMKYCCYCGKEIMEISYESRNSSIALRT